MAVQVQVWVDTVTVFQTHMHSVPRPLWAHLGTDGMGWDEVYKHLCVGEEGGEGVKDRHGAGREQGAEG